MSAPNQRNSDRGTASLFCCTLNLYGLIVHGEPRVALVALDAAALVLPLVPRRIGLWDQALEECLFVFSCLLSNLFASLSGLVQEVGFLFKQKLHVALPMAQCACTSCPALGGSFLARWVAWKGPLPVLPSLRPPFCSARTIQSSACL